MDDIPHSQGRAGALLLAATLLACRAGHPVRPGPAPAAPAGDSAWGNVGFSFLGRKPAVSSEPAEVQVSQAVPLFELPMPHYPQRPLVAHSPPAQVAVRIFIDTAGRVSEVCDSPLETSTPGPFLADFRQAVEEAVRYWEFAPAHRRRFEQRSLDDKPEVKYQKLVSSEPVVVYYDIRFRFEIQGGEGTVRPVGR